MVRRHQLDIPQKGLLGPISSDGHNGERRSAIQLFIGGKAPPGSMGSQQLPFCMPCLLLFPLFCKGSGHFLRKAWRHFTDIFQIVIGFLIAYGFG